MICPQCKHENPVIHRFCGICGAELPEHSGEVAPPKPKAFSASEDAPAQLEGRRNPLQVSRSSGNETGEQRLQGERRRPVQHPTDRESRASIGVSGPSFLGLGSEDAGAEEPRPYRGDDLYRTNWGARVLFALIVLAVAGGLAYKQWRTNHGFAGLFERPQAANAAQAANASPATAPPSANNSANPAPVPQGDQNAANNNGAAASNAAGMNNNGNVSRNGQGQSAEKNPSANSAGPAAGGTSDGSNAAGGASPATKNANENNGAVNENGDASQAEQSTGSGTAASSGGAAAAGSTVGAASSTDKSGANANNSDEPVKLAEVYLEGQGVPQNCDEGVGILRAADARHNARAAIKLGAIYATGECVPMDRVIAYHYFSKAEQEDPNNQWVDENRSILWANMTSDERARAKAADSGE